MIRSLPYNNLFLNALTYEHSLDKIGYYRSVYSMLDFFSAIGGLFSAFGRTCLLAITALNYFGSFQFVMADNFYYRSGLVHKNDVQWNTLKSLRLNIHTFFPKSLQCCCFKPSKA